MIDKLIITLLTSYWKFKMYFTSQEAKDCVTKNKIAGKRHMPTIQN